MNNYNIRNEGNQSLGCLLGICLLITIFVSIIICKTLERGKFGDNYYRVDSVKIDSLEQIRDSIIVDVERLESIKSNEIKKVYTISDSATVELFYKLLSK